MRVWVRVWLPQMCGTQRETHFPWLHLECRVLAYKTAGLEEAWRRDGPFSKGL